MKLSPKQRAFADYYIETGNATESARMAGYKGNNLNRVASENLSKLDIKRYIEERMKEIESNRIATAEEVLQYLTRVMRGEELSDTVVTFKDGYSVIQTGPSTSEKTKAADLIGKRYAIFTEKKEVELTVPVIYNDIPEED